MDPGIRLEECSPTPIIERIGRVLNSPVWSKWLSDTMNAFGVALASVSEQRMNDVVAAFFLAQVGSSSYAALRMLGKEPSEALSEARRELCRILMAALWLLQESYRQGVLEEKYKNALRLIEGQLEAGSEASGESPGQ